MVAARTAAGIAHLPLSWAAQISQSANTGLAFGFIPLMKAVVKTLSSREARDIAEDMGVLAMDIAFDFGGGHFQRVRASYKEFSLKSLDLSRAPR